MGVETALIAWKAGFKDGFHDRGVHDDDYPADADDYQSGWMAGEAERINGDTALLAAEAARTGALSDYQRGFVDGFDSPRNLTARAIAERSLDNLPTFKTVCPKCGHENVDAGL